MQALAQEMKQGGLANWLYLVGFTVRNRFWGWTFFLPSFVLNLAEMFTAAAVFYFMGSLVAPGANSRIGQYGMGYGTYIVTGVMFMLVMRTTLTTYHEAWLEGYWATQFDTYLQHPGGVSAFLTGAVIFQYFLAAINTLAYFLVGVWLFGVSVDVPNLPSVFVILALAVASLTGLGLIGASTFSLLNAKNWGTNPVEWLVGFAVTLLSGVYFPPTVLPEWLQRIGWWLPQTHALHAARLALGGNAGLAAPSVRGDVMYLIAFAAVSLPVGLWVFGAGMRKAERDGALTRWS